MQKNATVESMNVEIARFEGRKFYGKYSIDDYGPHHGLTYPEMKYHTSWDWLMPVVEKIETVEMNAGRVFRTAADVKIFYQACIIEYLPDEESGDPCEDEITIQTQGETKLEAVHKAVYQFITWYNECQQKQTNDTTGTNKG